MSNLTGRATLAVLAFAVLDLAVTVTIALVTSYVA